MKIYLDNCCYNRPFDEQEQIRIYLETQAKLHIQQLVLQRKLDLVCSFILRYENAENPDGSSRDSIAQFFANASEYVGSEDIEDIRVTAAELIKQGLKMKDAMHLACAMKADCDYFITTDDKLIKKFIDAKMKIRTPITFLNDLEE
jgi:predicted nucleic acid-binding protein